MDITSTIIMHQRCNSETTMNKKDNEIRKLTILVRKKDQEIKNLNADIRGLCKYEQRN